MTFSIARWPKNIQTRNPRSPRTGFKQRFRDAFYTDTAAWKERIVEQARDAAHQAVAHSHAQAAFRAAGDGGSETSRLVFVMPSYDERLRDALAEQHRQVFDQGSRTLKREAARSVLQADAVAAAAEKARLRTFMRNVNVELRKKRQR